jgi:hypothetical protein
LNDEVAHSTCVAIDVAHAFVQDVGEMVHCCAFDAEPVASNWLFLFVSEIVDASTELVVAVVVSLWFEAKSDYDDLISTFDR